MAREPVMGISIKNPKLEQDIRTLAARTGQSLTEAVAAAVEEKLSRTPISKEEQKRRMHVLEEIQARVAAMPILSDASEDEILGYSEFGTFD
jgi:antitoxin VapB